MAQLGVQGHQGLLGRRVLGHSPERSRLVPEDLAGGRSEDGVGDRMAGHPFRAEQLGQPERRDERDVGQASETGLAAPQQPSQGKPGEVGGDDDCDRIEGMPGLGRGDHPGHRLRRRTPVTHHLDVDSARVPHHRARYGVGVTALVVRHRYRERKTW